MEKERKEMMKLQNKMVLESLVTITDMIDGNRHFVIDNRDMIGGKDVESLGWAYYESALTALNRALSDVRDAKEELGYAMKKLEGGK